jgi:putative flavoprotein involved in K+ transport
MAPQRILDCVVVGAGPAGLAASAALSAGGVEHTVLERGRPGESWRTQRWDSFRLNTPGWMNRLLGEQARDAFLTGGEVARRLEALAADRPVRFGVRVERLAPAGDGYALETDGGSVRARTVVVSSGDQNLPRVPRLAQALPGWVAQCHTADYRDPGTLPPGGVLVVGGAQSGCQIAEDLLAAGRRVVLATSPVGRLPWRHRGRDTFEWLADAGFLDQRPQDLPDRSVMGDPQPIVASGGRSLSLQALARAGATLAGRLVTVAGERVSFDDSLAANLAAGDAFAARIRAMVDNLIERRGLPVPPPEADPTDAPVALDPPGTLDLRAEEIGSVIWCTGFGGDFSYLDPTLLGRRRPAPAPRPRRGRSGSVVPGAEVADPPPLGHPLRLPRRRRGRHRRGPGPVVSRLLPASRYWRLPVS